MKFKSYVGSVNKNKDTVQQKDQINTSSYKPYV